MHRFVKLLMTAALLAALVAAAPAAEVDGRWGVNLEGGLWKLVEGYWDHSNVDNFTGVSVRRGLTPHWTAELSLRYGTIRPGVENPTQDAGWTTSHYSTLITEIHNPTLNFQYLFLPEGKLTPFLGFGVGVTSWRVLNSDSDASFYPQGATVQGFGTKDEEYHKLQKTNFTFAAEAGAEWFLAESFSLRLGARYHVLTGNDLDNVGLSSWDLYDTPEYVDANKGLVQGFLGATLWFGGPKDDDDDGLENRYDRCPRAAEDYDGFEDEDGCPDYDNDNDGIADTDDPCPLDPEDRDGYQDDDGCPDPDNDGDGVLDAADRCPDTPAGTAVDQYGCPTAPAAPVAPAAVVALDEGLVLEGVSFKTGSAQLTAESISVLSRVATSLNDNPGVRVEVRGHTDSTGAAETNRDLSHRRAMAVRDVLIQLGVAPSRVTAVGYGEDYPIASNETREGRAKNRRVELYRIQ
jgi:outer membrane protein OmpA-like peptidoglycan-associated protein/opacity protein-like surface antigen